MKLAVLAITWALSAAASHAEANSYRIAGFSDDAGELLDVTTLTRTGDVVQGSSVSIVKSANGTSYNYSVSKTNWDCAGKRVRELSGSLFNARGDVLGSLFPIGWHDIIPDSLGEETLNAACAKRDPKNEVEFDNVFSAAKAIAAWLYMKK